MVPIDKLRHPKETIYYVVLVVIAVIIWLSLSGLILGFGFYLFVLGPFVLPAILFIVLCYYWYYLRSKAKLYGDAVKISYNQYPELYSFLVSTSNQYGVKTPDCFIVSSNQIGAITQKVFLQNYIILDSGTVDSVLEKGKRDELLWLIAFGIGHHAAGHLGFLKKLLIAPAYIIPLLPKAYSRACVMTADRFATYVMNDVNVAKSCLSKLALGSYALQNDINVDAFREQENEIPQIPAFVNKLSSSEPRTTVRLSELNKFKVELDFLTQYAKHSSHSYTEQARQPSANRPFATQQATAKYCHACGKENVATYRFCEDCGSPAL